MLDLFRDAYVLAIEGLETFVEGGIRGLVSLYESCLLLLDVDNLDADGR